MNKPEWVDQENQEYRNLTENRFSTYFKKHKHLWDSVSMQDRTIISDGVRKRVIGEGMLMEAITIYDWLDHIQSLS